MTSCPLYPMWWSCAICQRSLWRWSTWWSFWKALGLQEKVWINTLESLANYYYLFLLLLIIIIVLKGVTIWQVSMPVWVWFRVSQRMCHPAASQTRPESLWKNGVGVGATKPQIRKTTNCPRSDILVEQTKVHHHLLNRALKFTSKVATKNKSSMCCFYATEIYKGVVSRWWP